MDRLIAIIGFGEAGQALATDGRWGSRARAFDLKTLDPRTRSGKLQDYAAAGVHGAEALGEVLEVATTVLSLVTADQALAAAEAAASRLVPGALYCDFNSVSPGTKRRAAAAVEAAGGRYVDVGLMSPVNPARLSAPLLLAGPHAEAAGPVLAALGFRHVRVAGPEVGQAAGIKMLRSVIVKGIEALTAEAMLGARAAGLEAALIDALGEGWAERVPYNLERMATHGLRRAAEMEEAALTLTELGVDPLLTRGTIIRQRQRGVPALEKDDAPRTAAA